MHGRNIRIAGKVLLIEREQVGDAVDVHGGDQPGIVDLDSQYAISYHQATPFAMHLLVVRQEDQFSFDQLCFAIGLSNRQAETVAVLRPSCHVPEFHQVLRRVAERGAAPPQPLEGRTDNAVVRVVPVGEA